MTPNSSATAISIVSANRPEERVLKDATEHCRDIYHEVSANRPEERVLKVDIKIRHTAVSRFQPTDPKRGY